MNIKRKKSILYSGIIVSLACMFFLSQTSTYALTAEQKNLYRKSVLYYDLNASCAEVTEAGGASEGGPLTGVKFPQVADKAVLTQAIKDYIVSKKPNSPLVEYSDEFVKYGEKYDVNPLIAVIISQVEYQFGTLTEYVGPGAPGQNNFWAVTHGNTPGVRFGAYPTIDEAMEEHFKLLAGVGANVGGITYIGPPQNLTTIKDIMKFYAPAYENDTDGYVDTIVAGIKKILRDGGVTADPTASDQTTPEPGASANEGSCACTADAETGPAATISPETDSLANTVKQLAEENGGKTSISVSTIDGSLKASVNGDVQMPTRSSYKIYTAYATLRAIEASKISWNTPIWSGRTVEQTMEAMIVKSDNSAAEALRTDTRIGNAATVTSLLREKAGLSNKTIMGSGAPGSSGGTRSQSTANDFVKFLLQLEKKQLDGVTNEENYNKLLGYMKRATSDGGSARLGIVAGASGATVANKPGWAAGSDDPASNDVGIVYLEGKPYVVAILTDKPNQWSGVATIEEGIHAVIASSSSASRSDCGDESAGGGDLAGTIKGYAWPTYRPAPYLERRPAYASAVTKAIAGGIYTGGSVGGVAGIDCGGFVTLAMINSGFEPGYNYSGKGGNTISQIQWLEANWKKISPTSSRDLQPGDVAINEVHTYLYVGDIEGFNSETASASYSTSGNGRAPMAGHESAADPDFTWYRKK